MVGDLQVVFINLSDVGDPLSSIILPKVLNLVVRLGRQTLIKIYV